MLNVSGGTQACLLLIFQAIMSEAEAGLFTQEFNLHNNDKMSQLCERLHQGGLETSVCLSVCISSCFS